MFVKGLGERVIMRMAFFVTQLYSGLSVVGLSIPPDY